MSTTIDIHGDRAAIAPGLFASSEGAAHFGGKYRAAFSIWESDADGVEHRIGRVEIPVRFGAERVSTALIVARLDELSD